MLLTAKSSRPSLTSSNRQTLVAGYLPADPPPDMMPRAAARYRAQSAMSRYRSFVLPDHVGLETAVRAARGRKLESIKIEHQIAPDSRSAPVVVERWTIDAAGAVTHEPFTSADPVTDEARG